MSNNNTGNRENVRRKGPREIGPKETKEKTKEDFYDDEVEEAELVEVKLKTNIKYQGKRYAIGKKIKINEDDLDEFIKAGVIVQED